MLDPFDDYPIHQTPEPLAHPGTGDRNFYDRFFFNGYAPDGEFFFGAALGLYPNRDVMDASLSVVSEGRQHTVRSSRRLPPERGGTRVGPIALDIEEPMRVLRLRVAPNPFGLEADLRFRARTPAVEEPRLRHRAGRRRVMDWTRITQFGSWEGSLRVNGRLLEIDPARIRGCRDRSWGIRPVGEREAGAPPLEAPQFFWLWAPIGFEDLCTLFAVNEDAAGHAWHAHGCAVPVLPDPRAPVLDPDTIRPMDRVAHRVDWEPGTRWSRSARLALTPFEGEAWQIELSPLLTFQMLGLGYLHPEWGHGMWKGEDAVDGEVWKLADLAPLDPRHLHVQQLCTARMGDRRGVGVLEQLVIGPHAPSGFRELLDPAQ